eukprot:GEMP01009082.1.p1 GENE.GEMP01009082.1~~GEMP01009082.1.p1  ORF type:complete len:495 (+),score=89.47 GEMP01009082.1:164-1648(+)
MGSSISSITSKQSAPKKCKNDTFSTGTFIFDQKGRIDANWDMGRKKIGQGGYGYVVTGVHKMTRVTRAIKQIGKAHVKSIDRFKQEIAIMKLMDHPNIVKLYETYEDSRYIYLVMELCLGGELFDRIIELKKFNEVQAATIMQSILRALHYMHQQNVIHRDLKPENFLFVEKNMPIEESTLKIIDFGLSARFDADKPYATTKAGTPYYVAPQVLSGKYGCECDVWSAGVIMYIMLCGHPPFYGRDDAEVLSKVRKAEFSFAPSEWMHMSADSIDLIKQMLRIEPRMRITASDALSHVWIEHKAPGANGAIYLTTGLADKLRQFKGRNNLQKAAIHVIARQMDEDKIKKIKDLFVEMDTDNDGRLSCSEIKAGLAKVGEVPTDLHEMLVAIDCDGNGDIEYTEFLAAALDVRHFTEEAACFAAFNRFDLNGDGRIDKHELKAVLCKSDGLEEVFGESTLKQILMDADQNGDGEIDFSEFLEMMRAPQPVEPSAAG